MENFSCKQSKERGDCVCAAEQEEKTHQHKCKALSFAAGKLFGFNRSFFFFSCLFFSGRFRLCVHFYVKVCRCFQPAIGFFDFEKHNEHADNHNHRTQKENIRENTFFVGRRNFRTGHGRVNGGNNRTGNHADQ